ncbi:hypothetical protein BH11ARM1_BH11ARM1_01300 [soil metagenome]
MIPFALILTVLVQSSNSAMLESMRADGLLAGFHIDVKNSTDATVKIAIADAILNGERWADDPGDGIGLLVTARSYFPKWTAALDPYSDSELLKRLKKLSERTDTVLRHSTTSFPDIPNNYRFHEDLRALRDAGLLKGGVGGPMREGMFSGPPPSRMQFAGWTYIAYRNLEEMLPGAAKYRDCLEKTRRLAYLSQDLYPSMGIDGTLMLKSLDARLSQTKN